MNGMAMMEIGGDCRVDKVAFDKIVDVFGLLWR